MVRGRGRPLQMRRLLVLSLLVLLSLLSGCALVDREQRYWIFQPGSRSWAGASAAAEGMQDVWIPYTAQGRPGVASASGASGSHGVPVRLHGLWLPQDNADAPVVLYLHGARWDVRSSAPRMRRMHELGFAVLGVDYRGFGQSSPGLPSETLALEDARAAWDWLALRHPQARRLLFGHSLGGAVAVRLATEVPDLAGLVIEGGFPSTTALLQATGWGWLPIGALITQHFDSASRIGKLKVPVLVVHGSDDNLIPPALGQALFELANEPKRFVLVPGGRHHNTGSMGREQVRQAMGELFGLPPPQR